MPSSLGARRHARDAARTAKGGERRRARRSNQSCPLVTLRPRTRRWSTMVESVSDTDAGRQCQPTVTTTPTARAFAMTSSTQKWQQGFGMPLRAAAPLQRCRSLRSISRARTSQRDPPFKAHQVGRLLSTSERPPISGATRRSKSIEWVFYSGGTRRRGARPREPRRHPWTPPRELLPRATHEHPTSAENVRARVTPPADRLPPPAAPSPSSPARPVDGAPTLPRHRLPPHHPHADRQSPRPHPPSPSSPASTEPVPTAKSRKTPATTHGRFQIP